MITFVHALEHVSALIGLLVLVLLAWAVVKLRQYRLSEAERERARRFYLTSRPMWTDSAPADAEEDYRVQ